MSTEAMPGAFARYRPVVVAESLDDLRGPTTGVVTLPLNLDWGPNPRYDLAAPGRLEDLYSVVLTEAMEVDDLAFVNGDMLRAVWGELNLATRIRDRWEARFSFLKR